MNIKPTFAQDSQACPGVRFTMRVLNQITRAERDAELVEARSNIAELAAQMQRLPDPDEPIRHIDAAAKAESRERTPEEQAQIQAIEARPETVPGSAQPVYIYAMDAQSFAQFASNNRGAIANSQYQAIQEGHPLVQAIRAATGTA
jgi:hypothetical protein